MLAGRSEKRSAAAVAVMLTRRERVSRTELTVTENISDRGARVVYRQAIRKDTYAVGLELVPPTGNWRGE